MEDYIKKPVEMLGDASMVIAMEELAELQQAVSKGIRGKLDYNNLCEEVADVIIVLDWICHKYGVKADDLDKWLEMKQSRIIKRVEDGTLA